MNSASIPRRMAAAALAALACTAIGTTVSAAPASAGYGYACPGGLFCGWDGPDGTGSMIVQVDSNCVLHDIGNGGVGDRLTSYWNRTGKTVGVYNWTGVRWQLLASVPNNGRGNMPRGADNAADAVRVCA
ncbi:Peptidase inhibitor family I36 [Nocardia amikacinitolerans]|uniref:peptidase inhibitor family I36 protein n=1 Tax=Nocardia amikacinitolerans TaxID=756689 RepID=UPI000A0592CE|nr:peptidase inhibitor family I36 protein [Nocardia amikacinitolerans]MCP2320031.1 Peptidase inhibitor family I36 [Nocardia amikacinitolerans]